MTLPQSDILSTRHLNRVFDDTTATYKFYWLLGLLEYIAKGKSRISIKEMIVSMVANAWYPVAFFRLSFGKLPRVTWSCAYHTQAPRSQLLRLDQSRARVDERDATVCEATH